MLGEEKALGRSHCSLSVKGAYKRDGERLSARACCGRTGVNSFNLKEGRIILDIWNKFFTMKVVRRWARLPREAVDAPSLEVFKARLDGALGSLGWSEVSLPMAGG